MGDNRPANLPFFSGILPDFDPTPGIPDSALKSRIFMKDSDSARRSSALPRHMTQDYHLGVCRCVVKRTKRYINTHSPHPPLTLPSPWLCYNRLVSTHLDLVSLPPHVIWRKTTIWKCTSAWRHTHTDFLSHVVIQSHVDMLAQRGQIWAQSGSDWPQIG